MPRSLSLSVRADAGESYKRRLARLVRAAHAIAGTQLKELSIALVGDRKMSALHKQYMHLPGPTDVLTFPLEQTARGMAVAGEIVICVPEARRRARIEGTHVRDELILYAVHGLLHLSGHDDRTQRGFQIMHELEDEILAKIGVGRVFDRRERLDRKPNRRKHRRRA